jgi:hypothetical protein
LNSSTLSFIAIVVNENAMKKLRNNLKMIWGTEEILLRFPAFPLVSEQFTYP